MAKLMIGLTFKQAQYLQRLILASGSPFKNQPEGEDIVIGVQAAVDYMKLHPELYTYERFDDVPKTDKKKSNG